MTTHYPIAIIGGGLGGLTAARVLHTRGIEVAVFEGEASREVRTQGGMLDIHAENGQLALRAAGLFDEFLEHVHHGGESFRILDREGKVHREEADRGQLERPEIDRGELRDLLLDALPKGMVRWGSQVAEVRPLQSPRGRHEITLSSGEVFTTDLLIGADGAWSRVRALVSDAKPIYAGISFVEADLFEADARHPIEAKVMGAGMLFALGGATGILGHRETDGSLHCYLGHRADEGWLDTIDFTNVSGAKAAILKLLDGWAPELRALIANADKPLVPRRIHALPPMHTWSRTPGVTLLGDAAHLMSPFAGEGANLAMFDGSELALAIAAHPGDTEKALATYEAALFPRAQASAQESAGSLQVIFASDAPKSLLEMFAGMAEQATGK